MRTPLGPSRSVLIRGVSLFKGLLYICKMHSGAHALSVLEWMSVSQGCPQGRFPHALYHGGAFQEEKVHGMFVTDIL